MAQWHRERSHFLASAPDTVFEAVRDLSRTHEWMRTFHGFKLRDQPGQVGTKVDFLPPGDKLSILHQRTAPAGSITVLDVKARSITFTQPQPGGRLSITWRVEPAVDGSTVTIAVDIEGPLRLAFAKTVAEPLLADFPIAVARLYRIISSTIPTTAPIKCVIAGGRGYLGRQLTADLVTRGHDVFVLTRSFEEDFPAPQLLWDGKTVGAWADVLRSSKKPVSLVNLAGEHVDVEPSEENIERLRRSRIDSTAVLKQAVDKMDKPLDTWVQSSTTAIYGDAGETRLTEASPLPTGAKALPQQTGIARAWEQAAQGANAEHFCILRTSLVFGSDAPLLKRLRMLAETGLGGPIAGGQQWVSWIHVHDWLKLVRTVLGIEGNRPPQGPIHAATPEPIRNATMMSVLRDNFAAGFMKKSAAKTPERLLKLGARILGTDAALVSTSRHTTSQVLRDAYFQFEHPSFADAIQQLD